MAEQDWLGTPSPALEPGTEFVEKSMVYGCRVCSSTALIRRSAVPAGAFREEDAPPFDFAFWMRMAESWDIAFVDAALCRYRIHGQSFTSGLSDVTGTGYLQVEQSLREVHAVKRRHAATSRTARGGLRSSGSPTARWGRTSSPACASGRCPDRPFVATFRGVGSAARREPAFCASRTHGSCWRGAWSVRVRSRG